MNIPFVRLSRATVFAALAGSALPAAAQTAALPPATLAEALLLLHDAARALAPAGARVETLPGGLDPRLTLAPCPRIQPYLAGGAPVWGRTRVGLRCTEGPVHWNVFLPVTVQVWAPAFVPNTALPAGAKLASEMLDRAVVDWAAASQPPHAEAQALAGRTLARAVAAGQPLRAYDLQPRQWFAIGETVNIVAGGAGYAISTEGQALTPGVEGQPARVRTEAGRVLVARPVGDKRVEVSL